MEQHDQNQHTGMNGNPNLVGASLPKSQEKKRRTGVGAGIVFILLTIGYASNSNSALIDYFNNFAKTTYNLVAVEKWNKFLKLVQDKQDDVKALSVNLKTEVLPTVKEEIRKAKEKKAPDFAKEYHLQFTHNLESFERQLNVLVAALEDEEQAGLGEAFKGAASEVDRMETQVLAFRDKLATEKKIQFEKQ